MKAMRKPLIAANWKMHMTSRETEDFISGFLPLVEGAESVEIVIAPPFTSLAMAARLLERSPVRISGQNVFYEDKGAYTGEISPGMLKDTACSYVIIGHSERRHYFSETDEIVNRKLRAVAATGINVIFCIGETLEERETGSTYDVLTRQIHRGLKDIPSEGLVVAYEPVWAIGTGRTASPDQAQEAHHFVREELRKLYAVRADFIRILYGGSVKPENICSLMQKEDVDGALVGGASLKPESFARIVNYDRI
jgi:triosephosphate isomerase